MNCVRCGAPGVNVSSGICGPCSQKPYTIPVTVVTAPGTPGTPAFPAVREPLPVPTRDELVAAMLAAIPHPEGLELEISDEMKGLVQVMAGELVKLYERTK
jgi:hypothetical protein